MEIDRKAKILDNLIRRAVLNANHFCRLHLIVGAYCDEVEWVRAFPEEEPDAESLASLVSLSELRVLVQPHLAEALELALGAEKVTIEWPSDRIKIQLEARRNCFQQEEV